MALGQTDISVTLVKTILGESVTTVGGLCTSNNINKWSKYKPVSGTYPSASDGKYGFNLSNLWAYIKPSSVYRLGDFRGYEHNQANTMPPAYTKHTESSFQTTDTYDPIYQSDVSGTMRLNSGGTSEVTLTDLGLNNYYFGMYVSQPAHSIYYWKTLTTVASASSPQYIAGDLAMVEPYTEYSDFPPVINDGEPIYVKFILSSQTRATWSTSQPATWYILPDEDVNGVDIRSQYQMYINHWIIPVTPILSVFDDISASNTYKTSVIKSDMTADTYSAGWIVKSKPSWINTSVLNTAQNVTSGPFYHNYTLRAITNANNTGPYRSGSIVLGTSTADLASITVQQEAGPISVQVYSNEFTITDNGCSALPNYSTAYVSFTTSNSDLADKAHVWWYVVIGGNVVYSSGTNEYFIVTPQNSTKTISALNLGVTLYGGEGVGIYLVKAPYIPEL